MASSSKPKPLAKKKTAKAEKTAAPKNKKAKTPVRAKASERDYNLVVVESPAKAKTIKKYLGRGFQVVASNGHIKDLPKSKLGVDVKKNFETELVPITGKKNVIERIQELAKDADHIYLAPDPDREGEAIAFHLAEEIGRKRGIHRVLFNAITKKAVQEAIESPQELDLNKYDSQRTRRILDRLVGYKISPILWDKVQRGLSAGRVQSVALRIIVEKEEDIRSFVPEQWFSIHANFKENKVPFQAFYYGETGEKKEELLDEKLVKKILSDVKNKDFKILSIKKKERRQNPTPPFSTSKLQQEGANKLGFTAQRTMRVAQKLYEGVDLKDHGTLGLITYMRTDSVRTDPGALEGVRKYIEEEYGKTFLPPEAIIYTKKKGGSKVQDAHEAIRPTHVEITPEMAKADLSEEEFKLYNLIWNKFVSSQMAQAVLDQTAVMFESAGHFFKANGSIIKFAGFRTVYLEDALEKIQKRGGNQDEEDDSQKTLPDLKEGQKIKPLEVPVSEEHWTSPPPRYSEATLVKQLEEQGIGRPSTYASIISNIVDRGYVEKIENRFVPTELGKVVCKMLVESFPNEMDIAFTARVEDELDDIEEGKVKWTKVLKDFWKPFEKTLEKAKKEMANLKRQEIPTGITCIKCKEGEYKIKWGRNGQFLACSRYPECTSTEDFKKHLDGKLEIIPKEYVKGKSCPECGKRLVVKKGKYGRFLACEEYPNCKTTLPYTLDVNCPECKVGQFTEKTSRYGKIFFGCSSYPNCTNAMWNRPYKFACVSCAHPVMGLKISKKNGVELYCPKCKFKVPIESTPFAAEFKEKSEELNASRSG